jgi:hypothetical protein
VQVIIAPLPAEGKFIGASLLGEQNKMNAVESPAATLATSAGRRQ